MPKKDMRAALGASLKAEEKAVKSRFERAESALERKPSPPATPPAPPSNGRVIRDSFTTPAEDYGRIATIKQRCLKAGVHVTKSEVIRAGLHALEALSEKELLKVVERLTKVKPGRPVVTE